jgi:hypothetical protein
MAVANRDILFTIREIFFYDPEVFHDTILLNIYHIQCVILSKITHLITFRGAAYCSPDIFISKDCGGHMSERQASFHVTQDQVSWNHPCVRTIDPGSLHPETKITHNRFLP